MNNPIRKPQIISETLQPDGGLYWLLGYVSWSVGDRKVRLDGDFTPEELAAIANHINEVSKAKSKKHEQMDTNNRT